MQIQTILDQIDLGAIALPEFQRGYVWNRDQVRGLMWSLYKKHPVGGLLVWVTRTDGAPTRGDGPLAPGSVKLLLDGQQRIGADKLHPDGLGATPRRKPRGQERPAADIDYNRAFARRRVPVEHTIGRLRRYQALTQVDRHHRQHHTARVRAVAGLVNRRLQRWEAYRLQQAA